MFAFRHAIGKRVEKEKVYEKLAGVPGIIVESLLARFTELPRGSTRFVVSLGISSAFMITDYR